MLSDGLREVAATLDGRVLETEVLAGGFSHRTYLLTLTTGRVVVRLGGPDHAVEAAVMAVARRHVPVPRVLDVLPTQSAMVLEYVAGTPLSQVLEAPPADGAALRSLGAEVGRVAARVSSVPFDRPGFFTDDRLTIAMEHPWSRQLGEFSAECMETAPPERLDTATRKAWADLCAAHAPALTGVNDHARLVHSDLNPKNILVTHASGGWRVDAVLDWEFSYSGCPYADAANMTRFGADYPDDFVAGFRAAFADQLPTEVTADWLYLGRVLDMFALSGLVARPDRNPVAERAAREIRRWVEDGVPDSR